MQTSSQPFHLLTAIPYASEKKGGGGGRGSLNYKPGLNRFANKLANLFTLF